MEYLNGVSSPSHYGFADQSQSAQYQEPLESSVIAADGYEVPVSQVTHQTYAEIPELDRAKNDSSAYDTPVPFGSEYHEIPDVVSAGYEIPVPVIPVHAAPSTNALTLPKYSKPNKDKASGPTYEAPSDHSATQQLYAVPPFQAEAGYAAPEGNQVSAVYEAAPQHRTEAALYAVPPSANDSNYAATYQSLVLSHPELEMDSVKHQDGGYIDYDEPEVMATSGLDCGWLDVLIFQHQLL